MRTLLLALTLTSFVFAQDTPEPPQPTEPKEAPVAKPDPWAIEKPESKPEGDAVQLHTALGADKLHAGTGTLNQTVNSPMGPQQTEISIFAEVAIKESTNFEAPLQLKKITRGGMDITAQVAPQLAGAKLKGKLSEDGLIDGASITDEGLGPSGQQFHGFVHWLFPFTGKRDARKGEVWDLSAVEFAPKLIASKGDKVEGTVYQTLEGVEEKAGARCARLKSVFSFKISGAQMQGGARGDILVKGTATDWQGLDGFLRARAIDFNAEVSVMGQTVPMNVKIDVKAGPTDAPKPAAAEGCGEGCGGDGCGEMGGGG